jgi:organic radical activating enzyme
MRKPGESLQDYKVRMIDSISSSYCAAKWYNATIWLGHGQTTSCHHPPGHWIPKDELENNFTAIHNTQHKKLMRKMMQEGTRPKECEYCWKVEDIGRNNISDRVYKTEIYKDEDIHATTKLPWDADVELRTLEISFDRACNLKCSYCNPAFSTSWVKDINTYGPYQNIQSDGRGHFIDTAPWAESPTKKEEDNPYIQAFWKWWEHSLADNLEEIRITGGEPIMHKSTWGLFEWFKNNPERGRKMRFAINSNLNPETNKVLDKLIEQSWFVPNFEIYTSCEAKGKHAEYIRDGLNYEFWKSNVHRILKESNVKRLHVMMTINSLCLNSITEFMDEIIELRKIYGQRAPTMSLNILRFPSFQSAAILPDHIKDHYKNKLINWFSDENKSYLREGEIAHVQRLIDYLDIVKTPHKNTSEIPKLYNDFKTFYGQYDIRRNKNFSETFDEIFVDWFNSIEAFVPSKEDIENRKYEILQKRSGDPATIESYDGGDDEHEKNLGGWNVETDNLG